MSVDPTHLFGRTPCIVINYFIWGEDVNGREFFTPQCYVSSEDKIARYCGEKFRQNLDFIS